MALGIVLTGHFSNLIIFTSLIFVHELGHYFMAKIMKYEVLEIVIYPYGGFTKLNTLVNTNIYKDLLVAITGVIMQSIYFLLIYFLYCNGIIREYIYNLFYLYHRSMILFNLLPIIPLDGFKIVNLILSKFLSFNFSNYLCVFVSFFTIMFFLFGDVFERNYSIILIIGVLIRNIYVFYSNIGYLFNRFLIERYLYDISYADKKVIDSEYKMYKNKSHFFVKNGRIFSEKEFLLDFFHKKG